MFHIYLQVVYPLRLKHSSLHTQIIYIYIYHRFYIHSVVNILNFNLNLRCMHAYIHIYVIINRFVGFVVIYMIEPLLET